MEQLLPFLAWITFITLNALYHTHIIERKKRWPDHWVWTGIRLCMLVAIVGLDFMREQQILIGGAMLFPLYFNSILNLSRRKHLMYLSTHGVDGLLLRIIPSEFVWFVWESIIGIYGTYLIINGDPIW